MEGGIERLDTRVGKEVLDELKAQVRQKVEAELDQMMSRALQGAQDLTHAKLYTLEKQVREAALRLGGAVLEWTVVKGTGAGYEGSQRPCEHCNEPPTAFVRDNKSGGQSEWDTL